MQESNSKSGGISFLFILIAGVVVTTGLYFLQSSADQYFLKCQLINNDLGIAYGRLDYLVDNKTWITPVILAGTLLFFIAVAFSRRCKKRTRILLLSFTGGVMLLSLIPFCLSIDIWIQRLPENKIAKEMGLDEVPKRSHSLEYAELLSSNTSMEQKRLAARKLRFLGLQQQVQLQKNLDDKVIQELVQTASVTTLNNETRFLSAWALLVIDRTSQPAKNAIRAAIEAAATGTDQELKSMADDYIKNHDLFQKQ